MGAIQHTGCGRCGIHRRLPDGVLAPNRASRCLTGNNSAYQRIQAALGTGKDPGDPNPQAVLGQASGGGAPPMPPKLRELLDKLQKKEGDKPDASNAPKSETEPEIKEI